MPFPQVVAVDMDGTFLHSDDSYDRQRFARLRGRMEAAGVRLVVASGNQYEQLHSFFDDPDQISYVADNGALVVEAGEVLFSAQIEPAVVVAVAELLTEYQLPYLACGPRGAFAPAWVEDDYLQQMARYYHRLGWIDSIAEVADSTYKFGLVDERGLPPELPDRLAELVGDRVVPVVSGHDSMDLGAPGVNKASGISLLLERWGIAPGGLAAFGDSANDVEMLRLAGFSVAMENALPQVKAVASLTTGSNDADGVLAQLEKWFG